MTRCLGNWNVCNGKEKRVGYMGFTLVAALAAGGGISRHSSVALLDCTHHHALLCRYIRTATTLASILESDAWPTVSRSSYGDCGMPLVQCHAPN